jgi:hypothetical protein
MKTMGNKNYPCEIVVFEKIPNGGWFRIIKLNDEDYGITESEALLKFGSLGLSGDKGKDTTAIDTLLRCQQAEKDDTPDLRGQYHSVFQYDWSVYATYTRKVGRTNWHFFPDKDIQPKDLLWSYIEEFYGGHNYYDSIMWYGERDDAYSEL